MERGERSARRCDDIHIDQAHGVPSHCGALWQVEEVNGLESRDHLAFLYGDRLAAMTDDTQSQDPAAQMDELRAQLAETDPAVVIANHAYGLFELAAVYLSIQPPRLEEAQLAIDALAALADGVGDRLGEAAGPLNDALAQMRLAWVQLSSAALPQED